MKKIATKILRRSESFAAPEPQKAQTLKKANYVFNFSALTVLPFAHLETGSEV
jgi:hypothetical protein